MDRAVTPDSTVPEKTLRSPEIPAGDDRGPGYGEAFRALMETMNEGVAVADLIADDSGRPVDYVILDVNPAFSRQTGIPRERAVESRGSELPGLAGAPLLRVFADVAHGGRPAFFHARLSPEGPHVDIGVFSPEPGRLVAVLHDVSSLRHNEAELRYRTGFESVLAEVSTQFLNLPAERFDEGVNTALRKIGRFVAADRSYIYLFSEDGERMDNTHEWCAEGIEPLRGKSRNLATRDFPWWKEKFEKRVPFHHLDDELPPEAAAERERIRTLGIRSVAAVPMVSEGELIGVVGFDGIRAARRWRERDIALLKTVGNVFVHAFQRKESDESLRRRERELTIRTRIADAFLSSDEESAYDAVLRVVVEVLDSRCGILGYLDEEQNLVVPSMTALDEPEAARPERPISLPKERWVETWGPILGEGRPAIWNEPTPTPPGHLEVRRSLGVPIRYGDRVLGLIQVANRPGDYTKEDVRLLRGIAAHVAPILLARLERAAAERRRQEAETQMRQAQKMEAVGRLAGGIAHDFNNLLTVISGYTRILSDRMESSGAGAREAREIARAADRAASLTRQLLAFSRQQMLEMKVVNLNDLVTETAEMLRRLIGEHVELVTSLHGALGQVEADPGQIQQILMNLAINSRDAMPDGGRLTLETSNVELDDEYSRTHFPARPGPYVLLAVSDTGQGMDEQTRNHIFEPFFTTKEPGKGTGLGLSTAYGIVKQHRGFIWVYSELGIGTTFKIYLPRTDRTREAAAAESTRDAVAVAGGSETILLAEDEDAVRELTREVLVTGGYTVIEARGGAAGLQAAEEHDGPLHLLVTDVVMPDMDGGELFRRLSAKRPNLRVLYMSGYTDQVVVNEGVVDPDAHFLQKPFNLAALRRKVREVLDGAPPSPSR